MNNEELAKHYGLPPKLPWMNLTSAGMRLYLVSYGSGFRLLVENGDKAADAMKALNFKKAANGYWYREETNFKPSDFSSKIPGAFRERELLLSDILLDLTDFAPSNQDTENLEELAESLRANAPDLIGINKSGNPVYQEAAGGRYFKGERNLVREGASAASSPGLFLRAIDANMLAACADAYVISAERLCGADLVKPEKFMEAIGVTNRSDFDAAVSAAAVRVAMKNKTLVLADRYERAAQISDNLKKSGFKLSYSMETAILARRMLGLDKDLRGEGLHCVGAGSSLLELTLPQSGVRVEEDQKDATICVQLSADPESAAVLLDQRPLKTKTISIISVDTAKKAKAISDAIAKQNHVEGACFVPAKAGGPHLIMSVISTDTESEPFTMTEADTPADAWAWASTLAMERSHAVENFKAGLATDSDFSSASPFLMDNSYQIPYSSAAKGTPTSLVPKELSAATRVALDRVISNYGDVDEKVANECGFDKDKMSKLLAPEQVDGIALMINAEERGRGVVCGDGTGVGKGRQIMAMVRRAVLKGQRCLVFSESTANLADLMRDVKHLDSLDVIKPLLVNDDKLIDEDTKEEFETLDRSILDKAIENMEWPEGVSVIMSSYSQFNKKSEDSAKTRWIKEIVDDRVSLFGDEIHNAASINSNASDNYAHIKEKAAVGIVSASATYAKESKNIAFYKEIFPDDIDMNELQAMMIKGGEPFQEVVSDMLTADGVFFRRETDLSDIEFEQQIDIDKLDENREIADKMSIIIAALANISEVVAPIVRQENIVRKRAGQENLLRTNGIGSSLYLITRLLNAALIAEYTADKAIEELKAGNKPGFLLENTVGELLQEAYAGSGDQPTFRDILLRCLNQTVAAGHEEGHHGILAKMQAINPDGVAAYNRAIELINSFPPIPASVIDTVKNRIKDAGYTIGEITGRTLEVNRKGKVVHRKDRNKTIVKNAFNSGEYDCVIMNSTGATGMDLHAGRRFKDRRRRVLFELQGPANVLKQIQAYGRYSRRDQESAPKIVFVGTGLPYEVRLATMRNQKLRRLSANIQSNRDNSYLLGNIPDLLNPVGDAVVTKYGEQRPDLLHRLVLTERYSRRSKLIDVVDDQRDFEVQPEKATEVAVIDDHPAVNRGFEHNNGDENEQARSANEFLSRLSLLPCKEQERVLHQLTAEYEMHIAELESLGQNPLRPREFDGTVNIRDSKLFEGSIDTGANSSFEAPMYLMEAIVEREFEPMSSEVVLEALEGAAPVYENIVAAVDNVIKNRDRYLAHYLRDEHLSVDDAIDKGDRRIISMAKDIDHLKQAIDAFTPGRQITFIDADGKSNPAIIASISPPWEGSEHLMASYRMKIAIPGTEALKEYGVETILRNNGVSTFDKNNNLVIKTTDGLEGNDYEKVLESFDKASKKRLDQAKFLVGNVFRAVRYATQFKLGSLVSFVDHKGMRHRGVLINKQAERRLSNIAVRIEGVEAVHNALSMGIEVNSSPTGTGRNLVITPLHNGSFAVRIPEPYTRRNIKQWPSEGYRKLYETMKAPEIEISDEEKAKISKTKLKKMQEPSVAISGTSELAHVLDVVFDAGYKTFFVDPKHRDKVGYEEPENHKWVPEETTVKTL